MQASENFLGTENVEPTDSNQYYSQQQGCGTGKVMASKAFTSSPPSSSSLDNITATTPGSSSREFRAASPELSLLNHYPPHHHHRRSSSPLITSSNSDAPFELLSRVVENVMPGVAFGDEENRGYDLFSFGGGGANSSLNSTGNASSSSPLHLLDDSSNSSSKASDSLLAPAPARVANANANAARPWSKNNVCTPRTLKEDNREPVGVGEFDPECSLCFLSCNWPAPHHQHQHSSTSPSLLFQFRPVLDNCKCQPCQCTFDNNYCGSHDFGAAGACC